MVSVWIAVHALIVLLFLMSAIFGKGISVDADLFHMLPSSTLHASMGKADEKLSDTTAKNIFVLAGHDNFEEAKKAAEEAYSKLKDDDNFASITLYADTAAIDEIENFTAPYRWNLLKNDTIESLENGAAGEMAESALASIYGSFTLTSLSHLEDDPFLLDERNTANYLLAIQEAGTKMSAKDGVLASNFEGKWYVMIRATLSDKGFAIASKDNGITAVYAACNPLEKDGVRFVYSGTPFHSHKSSNSAVQEVSIISAISISIVVIMLILVFRSPLPLFASVLSILISIGSALAATMTVFGQIHIMTLVLGTSLIGSCIDYSLHYFVNWKAHTLLKTTSEIRSHLVKGLFLSMLSTEICYSLLIFAPFAILKQMGVFSSIGILSSFLTVICMYPLFPLPKSEKRTISLLKYINPMGFKKIRHASMIFSLVFIALTLLVIAVKHKNLRIENDMNKLYTMEGRVKDDTILCVKITGYSPEGWFIVSGKDEEELLQNEEKICRELDKIPDQSYLAMSKFIPSLQHQERSIEAAKSLLPLAAEQFAMLGFGENEYVNFQKNIEKAMEKRMIPSQVISSLPDSVKSISSMLWLGQIDGRYCSIVLPTRIIDEELYAKIAGQSDEIYYENKMKDLGLGLDSLTKLVAMLFCIAYLVIIIVLKFFYTWKQTLKIASLPLMCVLLIVAVFQILGNAVEFFSLTGIILVFGLGLDYIIYMIENLKREAGAEKTSEFEKLEPFAIALSFVTTAISFGALVFSTFVPVHTIGLTITLGLIAAFVCTIF